MLVSPDVLGHEAAENDPVELRRILVARQKVADLFDRHSGRFLIRIPEDAGADGGKGNGPQSVLHCQL